MKILRVGTWYCFIQHFKRVHFLYISIKLKCFILGEMNADLDLTRLNHCKYAITIHHDHTHTHTRSHTLALTHTQIKYPP